MRILIADDSTAGSKSLRAHFAPPSRRKSSGRAAMAAGQLVISCAPAKTGRGKEDECSCHGLDLGDQPEQATAILDALGIALLNRGCLKEGGELIKLALDIRRKVFGNHHPLTALSLNSTSRVQRERGDYDSATNSVQDALQINRTVYGPDSLPVAISLYELGVVQLQQGLYAAAAKSAQDGIDILTAKGLDKTDPNTTRLMDVRGRAETGLDKLAAADATYTALLKLDLMQLGTKQHPKYATHLANYGLVQEAMKKPKPAEKAYRNAIELYDRSLNRHCHPNLIDAYANLGSLLRTPPSSPKRIAEAGVYFRKARDLGLKVRGKTHALVGNDFANYGRWEYDSGKTGAAARTFETARQIYAEAIKRHGLPADHFYLAEALTWNGRILVEADTKSDAAKAEPLLREAIAKWPAQRGPGSAGEGIALACLGRAIYLLNDRKPGAGCPELCAGYAIIQRTVGDKKLVQRVADWVKQQACNCNPSSANQSSTSAI